MSLKFQLTAVATLRKRLSKMMPLMAVGCSDLSVRRLGLHRPNLTRAERLLQDHQHQSNAGDSAGAVSTSTTAQTVIRPAPGRGRAWTDPGQARADKLLEREKPPELQLTSISQLCSVSLKVKAKNFTY